MCDPAVGSGAFPVGMMNEIVQARNILSVYLGDGDRNDYEFKRRCIEHSLYGVDIDPGAVEIAKLRLWLSLVVDEEDIKNIKPLPNLDYKIVCGNSLLGYPYMPKGLEYIEKLKDQYFNETRPVEKIKLRQQIDKKLFDLFNNTEKSLGYKISMDFKINFSEVFNNKGGFDVVIGNPPYGADLTEQEKHYLNHLFAKNKSQVKNSAIYFIYKANGLLHNSGINTYIVPKSLCYSMGWNRCACFVLKGLQKLIDTGKAFEEVKLEQVIFVKTNDNQYSDYVNGIYNGYKVIEFTKVSKDIFKRSNVLLTGQTLEELNLIYSIIEKFNSKWGNYVSIVRGLNWQSKSTNKHNMAIPIYRGAQLSPYFLNKATDFIDISKFNKNEYTYQFKPKILNQLAIAHVQNPYPHFFLQAALDLENKLVFETISCTFVKNSSVSIKFLLAINNSKLFAWLLYKFVYSNAIRSTRYDEQYIAKVPCPNFETINQKPIIFKVDYILTITKDDDYLQNPEKQAKVKEYEKQIDKMVYELYGLADEEIKIVEGTAF